MYLYYSETSINGHLLLVDPPNSRHVHKKLVPKLIITSHKWTQYM